MSSKLVICRPRVAAFDFMEAGARRLATRRPNWMSESSMPKIWRDPDPQKAAETACELWGHEIVGGPIVARMGPRQEEGIRFLVDEVLPKV